jgi:RHS repeat-associated protein
VYDANQRLQSTANPENGTVSYTYKADGALWTKIDAKNQKIEYVYDANQRVSQIQRYPVSTGAEDTCQRVTFTYGTAAPSNGRLVTATWGSGSCASTGNRTFSDSYTYTNSGLVLTKRLTVDAKYLESTYTYDTGGEGKMTSVKYPSTQAFLNSVLTTFPGVKYTYTFDSMGRPNKLTDDAASPVDWVKNLAYGVAGEMTSMQFYTGTPTVYNTETRTYNTRLQLTRLTTVGGPSTLDMEYRYSATQNNGRITSQKDWVSGEDVTYQYDSLNRLISAVTVGPEWGQSFTYDGFGNLTAQTVTKGSAPAMSINVDAATNRVSTSSGYGYDANGNVTTMPGQSGMTYDVDNRLATATGDTYAYAPDSKRVWKKKPDGSQEIYFYGLGGQKLGAYIPRVDAQLGLYLDAGTTNLYFGGKLIRAQGQTVVTDRLGSVRSSGMRYFPYGAEQTVTGQDKDKFATYYRDGTTGLDYADQRYYGSTVGRFLTGDPYQASGGPSDPGSWNRYAYVKGDPANKTDRSGLDEDDGNEYGDGGDLVDCGPFGIIPDGPCRSFLQSTLQSTTKGPFGGRRSNSRADKVHSTKVTAGLAKIRKTIDPDCLDWLKSGIAGGLTDVFNSFFNELLGKSGGSPLAGAEDLSGTGDAGANARMGFFGNGLEMTINSSGAFFDRNVSVGNAGRFSAEMLGLKGGTPQAQTFILLHELAHYFVVPGFVRNDGNGNPQRQEFNNDLVWEKCEKTIRGGVGGGA